MQIRKVHASRRMLSSNIYAAGHLRRNVVGAGPVTPRLFIPERRSTITQHFYAG